QAAEALAKVEYREPDVVSAKPKEPVDVVWIEDDTPPGAVLAGDGAKPWQWGTEKEQPVHSGARSSKRSGPGLHQHYFTGAQALAVGSADDRLFAYVYLDPKDPPKSVMLQFNDGQWEHRAYWGEDLCYQKGTPDQANHRKVGPLPKPGEWVRLEVAPEAVGLK